MIKAWTLKVKRVGKIRLLWLRRIWMVRTGRTSSATRVGLSKGHAVPLLSLKSIKNSMLLQKEIITLTNHQNKSQEKWSNPWARPLYLKELVLLKITTLHSFNRNKGFWWIILKVKYQVISWRTILHHWVLWVSPSFVILT